MKKLFFIAAIAGAALVSCTKNELAPSATEQHEITFSNPVSQVVTKVNNLVPETYTTNIPFAVYADHHFDNFATAANTGEAAFSSYMRGTNSEGVVVTYDNTATTIDNKTYDNYWKPSSKYYWPSMGYLSFAAYSPSSIAANMSIEYTAKNGVSIAEYTTPEVGAQHDLMLSNRTTDQLRSKMDINVGGTSYDGVNIAFKHVLSAISFIVKTDEDKDKDYAKQGYSIILDKLTVKNAYNKGTLTQFATNFGTTVDLAKVWTKVWNENETGYQVNSAAVTLTDSKNPTTKAVGQWATNNQADLILIPQTLDHNGATEGGEVYVEVKYTVKHADMPEKGIQYTHNLPLGERFGTWEPNTRYLYTIIIGMEEIVFAPTIVTDWATPVGTDPSNKEDINL